MRGAGNGAGGVDEDKGGREGKIKMCWCTPVSALVMETPLCKLRLARCT